MNDTVIIERRFNGPRLSGNGGYVGGLMADKFTEQIGGDGTVEITLRAPIPIERTLQAAREAVQKLTGEVVPATAAPDACPTPPCARV